MSEAHHHILEKLRRLAATVRSSIDATSMTSFRQLRGFVDEGPFWTTDPMLIGPTAPAVMHAVPQPTHDVRQTLDMAVGRNDRAEFMGNGVCHGVLQKPPEQAVRALLSISFRLFVGSGKSD